MFAHVKVPVRVGYENLPDISRDFPPALSEDSSTWANLWLAEPRRKKKKKKYRGFKAAISASGISVRQGCPDRERVCWSLGHLHKNDYKCVTWRFPLTWGIIWAPALNPALCSLTPQGQLCLRRGDAGSAGGRPDLAAGMLIDGGDAYQPRRVTDT